MTPNDPEVHRALGRIEGKLDGLSLNAVTEREARIKLEGRVEALEAGQARHANKLAYWGGGLAVLAGLWTLFRAKLERFFS
ncbi:hypothetical protein EJV44_22420 [Ancylobacter aquaticus]|nr:hypothetical protein EJV44_22420 [Ancylobacter aquaticus]